MVRPERRVVLSRRKSCPGKRRNSRSQTPAGRRDPTEDFLAGANLGSGDPEMLLFSMKRFFRFLPGEQKQEFLEGLSEKAS